MKLSVILAVGMLAIEAASHGPELTPSMLKRHSGLSKRCEAGVANLNKKRYEQRMKKRNLDHAARSTGNSTFQITTEAPYYETIQNDTCVLSPDVIAGPYYWPQSQLLRQDMGEGEPGVPLLLDIGILDMKTCEPLPNALVSLWHCNATGHYSSFAGIDPNANFGDVWANMNKSGDPFIVGETDIHTDDETFLRGMWPSNDEGVLEMKTVYPGFYIDRTVHIHVQVFTDWVVHSNGSIKTGDLHSIGQLYFNEEISDQIMATEPYAGHTEINRTINSVDSIYKGGFEGGFNPVFDAVPLDGKDVRNGLVGYVTLGVDTEHFADLGRFTPSNDY